MLQVRDDNAAAFEELVLRYQDRLLNVLERLVRDRDLAEDLTQETFLRIYRSRKSYSPDAKFCTWLYTIANNVASNARRSKFRRKEFQVTAAPSESGAQQLDQMALAASGLMPARQLDKAEMAHVVKQAIDSLNEPQRMALMLCKYEEMSYADISAAMGLSVPAVKSLLWRARESLRLILEPYLEAGARPK